LERSDRKQLGINAEVKQMSSWVEVGKAGELAKGAMKEVLIKEQEILLVRVGDNYYASDNRGK